ncbi:MAG: transporter associated domain-containing protein [Gaiellaceae bacterium]
MFGELGRQPERGDEVRVDGIVLTVVEVEGSRIQRLEVEFLSPDEGNRAGEDEAA